MAWGIVNRFNYPSSAKVGDTIELYAEIKNTGNSYNSSRGTDLIEVQFGYESGRASGISNRIPLYLSTNSVGYARWSFKVTSDFGSNLRMVVRVYSHVTGEGGLSALNYLTDSRDAVISVSGTSPTSGTQTSTGWYLYPKPSATLVVNSYPSGAKVYLNGKYIGYTSLTYTVEPDQSYEITAELSGYRRSRTIYAIAGETHTINFDLSGATAPSNVAGSTPATVTYGARTATIEVDTNPRGAKIYINNIYTGYTTKSAVTVEPGTHIVTVRLSGYLEESRTVTVTAGEYFRLPVINLRPSTGTTPAPGRITVNSNPTGADIYVDDKPVNAKTNTTITVEPGNRKITLKKEGYYDATTNVWIASNASTSVDLTLRPKPGTLIVNSNVTGAKILIDYVPTSQTTPNATFSLTPGDHTVTLQKVGYKEKTEYVNIKAGETKEIYITLEPFTSPIQEPKKDIYTVATVQTALNTEKTHLEEPTVSTTGIIFVSTDNEPTDLYINDEYAGQTPNTFIRPPGTYVIKVKKDGYISSPEFITIQLKAGDKRYIKFRMIKSSATGETKTITPTTTTTTTKTTPSFSTGTTSSIITSKTGEKEETVGETTFFSLKPEHLSLLGIAAILGIIVIFIFIARGK